MMFGQLISNSFFSMTGSMSVFGAGGGGGGPSCPFVRQERERHAEDIDVLRLEEVLSPCRTRTKRAAARAPRPARRATGWRTRASPMMCVTVLGVPAFREHADRDDVLDLLAGLPFLPTVSTCRGAARPVPSLVSFRVPARPRRRRLRSLILAVQRNRLLPALRPCPAPWSRCAE